MKKLEKIQSSCVMATSLCKLSGPMCVAMAWSSCKNCVFMQGTNVLFLLGNAGLLQPELSSER